jgi:transcriptional regulator with XRE-family HTH domain
MLGATQIVSGRRGGGVIVRRRSKSFGPVEILQEIEASASERAGRAGARREDRTVREVGRVALSLGQAIREERIRRGFTLAEIARSAGVGTVTVHDAEAGRPASLETYVRLAGALRLRPEFELADASRRERPSRRGLDSVHAAMGEIEAAHLRAAQFRVGIDEPYQHFQFAGRADVVAWSAEHAALLHLENRTEFPDVQESFGVFNAKRRYLGPEMAARAGISRWVSETHVIVALWTADVLRVLRTHRSSFGAVCPDDVDGFENWWSGEPPPLGRRSILVVFDPLAGSRADRRRWVGLSEVPGVRARYRDYAEAARSIAAGG